MFKQDHILFLEAGLNEQALLLHSWHGPEPFITSQICIPLENT